jgi:hypothetical protein
MSITHHRPAATIGRIGFVALVIMALFSVALFWIVIVGGIVRWLM